MYGEKERNRCACGQQRAAVNEHYRQLFSLLLVFFFGVRAIVSYFASSCVRAYTFIMCNVCCSVKVRYSKKVKKKNTGGKIANIVDSVIFYLFFFFYFPFFVL